MGVEWGGAGSVDGGGPGAVANACRTGPCYARNTVTRLNHVGFLRHAFPRNCQDQPNPHTRAPAGELETEEGVDHPLSEVPGASNLTSSTYELGGGGGSGGGGPVWRWLKAWVYAAARAAPTRTEAMLHQFLGQVRVWGLCVWGGGVHDIWVCV